MLFCGKFILDIIQQILSESANFYIKYDRNILAYFSLRHSNWNSHIKQL